MPRKSKGVQLWLRPERRTAKGIEKAVWIIRDGRHWRSTGCSSEDRAIAEEIKAEYILDKRKIDRTPDRSADQIAIADVLNMYLAEVAPNHARPKETASRVMALSSFWGSKRLSAIDGPNCRQYARERSTPAAARRELEDLRAAIEYHRREGLCRETVKIVLPPRSQSRDRWLTREEAARLIWAAWRYREIQKGVKTDRRSRQHVARFILVGLYTGTRAGAVCGASFEAGPGHGFLDLDRGVFYRKAQGARETKKRQPPVRIPDRLLAHLRRWKRKGISTKFAVEWYGEPVGRVNKAFARAAKDAKLGKDVTPHVLRHTAATWTMQAGVDLAQAAGFLGMTVETLERVYGHHHPAFQEEAAAGVTGRRR